jgi:BMFP domain-containing protein YqiC
MRETFEREERDTLTSLARSMVSRSLRAGAEQNVVALEVSAADVFSEAGVDARVTVLEEQFRVAFREWSKNLNTVMIDVERLERRCQKLDGEVAGLREIVDGAERALDAARESVTPSATLFAETFKAQVTTVLDRLDLLVKDTFKAQSMVGEAVASIVRTPSDADEILSDGRLRG